MTLSFLFCIIMAGKDGDGVKKEITNDLLVYVPFVLISFGGFLLLKDAWRWICLIFGTVLLVGLLVSLYRILKKYKVILSQKEEIENARRWYQEHQDPETAKKMKYLTYFLVVVELIVFVVGLLDVISLRICCILSLGFTALSVFLPIRYPAYFSFQYGTKYDKLPVESAMGLFLIPGGFGMREALVLFTLNNWKEIWLPMVGFLTTVAVLLWGCTKFVDEDARTMVLSECVAIVVFLTMFGYGPMMQLNHVLSEEPPEYHPAVVLRIDRASGGMYGTGPSLDVLLHTGERKNICVRTQITNYAPGMTIMLEHRKGGLGVDYILALRDKPLIG